MDLIYIGPPPFRGGPNVKSVNKTVNKPKRDFRTFMVNEPYVDPPRPPTEEQRRMLIEAGRDFDMWGTQRYTSETVRYAGPVVYSEGGLLSGRSSKTSPSY